MRVIAYAKYGALAASTRHRILGYRDAWKDAGIDLVCRSLLPDAYVASLVTGERYSRAAIAHRYLDRLLELAKGSGGADAIWVYAELFPYLPMSFERLVFRHAIPVIYDWDDAFYVPYDEHPSTLVRKKIATKFPQMLARASAVTCGNAMLADYCSRYCDNTVVVPTVVDTSVIRPSDDAREVNRKLTLGWIGSPSTWANVRPVLPLIVDFCRTRDARFRVVGAGTAAAADRDERMDFVDWSEAGEVKELQGMDIGLMPLIDGPFERGKSGFKLIQYMACGLPVIASPVGANVDIVGNGDSGLLASSAGEWRAALERLARDDQLRRRMGEHGRRRVEQHYSVAAQAPRLIELFRQVAR